MQVKAQFVTEPAPKALDNSVARTGNCDGWWINIKVEARCIAFPSYLVFSTRQWIQVWPKWTYLKIDWIVDCHPISDPLSVVSWTGTPINHAGSKPNFISVKKRGVVCSKFVLTFPFLNQVKEEMSNSPSLSSIGYNTKLQNKTWPLITICVYRKAKSSNIKCLPIKFLMTVGTYLPKGASWSEWFARNPPFWVPWQTFVEAFRGMLKHECTDPVTKSSKSFNSVIWLGQRLTEVQESSFCSSKFPLLPPVLFSGWYRPQSLQWQLFQSPLMVGLVFWYLGYPNVSVTWKILSVS